MSFMRKKHFILVLVFVLLLSLTACGGSDESEEVPPEVLAAGESIQEGDTGSGPITIESRFGSITIPEGLDYELYTNPLKEGSSTVQVNFGKGNTNAGSILVSTTRMISSLDDVANECIRANDYGIKDPVMGDDVTFGDLTYKSVTIEDPDRNAVEYYLVSYYKTANNRDVYIEVYANGNEEYDTIDIDDPLVAKIMEKLVLNDE